MNYKDLINIDCFEKKESFNAERGGLAFYCKNCEEIVKATRKDLSRCIFTCEKCGGSNIAIGTLAGLKENYKIK